MYLPVLVLPDISPELSARWREYYTTPSDRNRRQEEGIWRRTQTSANASESGWTNAEDQRRRIVYYLLDFSVATTEKQQALGISGVYIYYSLTLPEDEVSEQLVRTNTALATRRWQRRESASTDSETWQLGDLRCEIQQFRVHPQDLKSARLLPTNYRSLDVTIRSENVGAIQPHMPWDVLARGIRVKDQRGNPTQVEDLAVLLKHLPFQVEIGCGVSIEAGVPALHHLHELYCVTDLDTGRFIFGGEQDTLIPRILRDPASELPRLGTLFASAFIAEPTLAHRALLALRRAGYLVGPIMTNNFDGLAHRSNLPELYLRRYDEDIPEVDFDDRARGLLVIGSHADRRRVQLRARERGMQVIFLDPEGYQVSGRFVSYPLEGPSDADFLCRRTASDGLAGLCRMLGLSL